MLAFVSRWISGIAPRTPRRAAALAAVTACAAAATAAALVLGPQPRLGRVAALEYTVLDGSKHTTAQWQGRVTLVNFWATTCAECLREMPRLVDTHQRYRGQGLDVVAVAMRHDPPAFVLDYANKRALPFAVAFDPLGEMARGFDNTAVTPTMFVVNRRGEIVRRYVGTPDFAQLHGLIEELLAQPG